MNGKEGQLGSVGLVVPLYICRPADAQPVITLSCLMSEDIQLGSLGGECAA